MAVHTFKNMHSFITTHSQPTSGVSAGHIMPHKVLWSCRGLANLPSLPIGEFTRLKWESVDAKVNLFNT